MKIFSFAMKLIHYLSTYKISWQSLPHVVGRYWDKANLEEYQQKEIKWCF